jgi:purine-binding chemotaxis protein CheW
MTFRLAGEEYGLSILKVRELIGMQEITRVPGTPAYLRGVLNLRGRVIPVIDLRTRFEMPPSEVTVHSVIIVVQHQHARGEMIIGALVDEVFEVLNIDAAQTEPPPAFGVNAVTPDFILGIGKVDKRVVFLLDVDRVLSADDRSALASAAAQ